MFRREPGNSRRWFFLSPLLVFTFQRIKIREVPFPFDTSQCAASRPTPVARVALGLHTLPQRMCRKKGTHILL